MKDATIAILGAGPIGIETALYALEQGYEVDVYEQDAPGAHLARWAHVRFFSPWKMNRSPWAERVLREAGRALGDQELYPTGREYLDDYLLPLARAPQLRGRIHEGSRVLGVARRHAHKGDFVGDERRADDPFVILLDEADGQRYAEADIVIDTTGVYGQPGHLGPGGLPALGEGDANGLIERYIPDALGVKRDVYADQATLLVGSGYSAVTSAHLLSKLRDDAPDTTVYWLLRHDGPPYEPSDDDPLPERLALATFGNEAARGQIDGLEPIFGTLTRLKRGDEGLIAQIGTADGAKALEADRIIANVGYRPRNALYRELQIHQCYASEGPMNLAAYLLSQQGGSGDCLEQSAGGFDTLVSPEPNFFILGAKSYGRNSDFLLKLGFEQIEELFAGLGE